MIFINEAITWKRKPISVLREFLILLQPFAPHLSAELWSKLSKLQRSESKTATTTVATTLDLSYAPWPKFDPSLLVEDMLEIPVQVNGKLRDVIRVPANATQAEIEQAAVQAEKAQPFLAGKTVRKIIVVPRRLVNLIVS